jgi:D-threo-aldose 1-dehydrogenase
VSTTTTGHETLPATATRRLGRTRLSVTAFGLGGAPLGDFFETLPDERAHATLAAAYRRGIRLFDTSPAYGLGLSEHRFGHVLRALPRHDFVLSTKVGRYLLPEAPEKVNRHGFKGGLNMRLVTDYGYDATLRAVDQSFQRLGIERIDLILIHDVDMRSQGSAEAFERVFATAMDGAYRAIHELRQQGVIGAIGIGVHEVAPCLRFAAAGDFDCFMIAGPYTLLDQAALDELMPVCARHGISLLAAGPFCSGILATGPVAGARFGYRPAPPDIMARVAAIAAVCARHGVPLPAAALQFPLRHPAVASVVAGAVSEEEVERNIALMSLPIPADLWDELKAMGFVRADAP